jgi:hypothetical protein
MHLLYLHRLSTAIPPSPDDLPEHDIASRDEWNAFPRSVAEQSFCSGRLVAYGREFARLQGVVVDRRYCVAERRGGEPIQSVVGQPEWEEYYRFKAGCFQLVCPDIFSVGNYAFNVADNHLNDWLRSLERIKETGQQGEVHSGLTLAVTRYEYVNLYHTMTDWYNAFLLTRFFHVPPRSVNILFVDAHPYGALDAVWTHLFNSTFFLSDLPPNSPTYFTDLAWGWLGYNSPIRIYASAPCPRLFEDFRRYFLSAFDIRSRDASSVNCSGLSVLFIWRHDYVAHPRNPSGAVTRKIANEDELLRRVRSRYPGMQVEGAQIDKYSMRQQLEMVAATDILIGEIAGQLGFTFI